MGVWNNLRFVRNALFDNSMKPIIVDPADKNVRIVGKVERVIKKV